MLWLKKRSGPEPIRERDVIVPADLPMVPDAALFQTHLSSLERLTETEGGIEPLLQALGAKQRRFTEVLAAEAMDGLGIEDLEGLLEQVFTARRRLYPLLEALGGVRVAAAVNGLLFGEGQVGDRIRLFAEAMPVAAGEDREARRLAAKQRRAATDFAAELLHFRDPVKYPLMTRWVWDRSTMTGALREFLRGADHLREIPFDMSPELYEGARKWLAERIAERGIYRDVPFWIDLVLAQAYVGYLRSVAEGNLGGDFGRGVSPLEQLRKLLGVDQPVAGRSRVKRAV